MMSVSQVRQNYHEESEAGVNKQINLELYAFYTYRSLVSRETAASHVGATVELVYTASRAEFIAHFRLIRAARDESSDRFAASIFPACLLCSIVAAVFRHTISTVMTLLSMDSTNTSRRLLTRSWNTPTSS